MATVEDLRKALAGLDGAMLVLVTDGETGDLYDAKIQLGPTVWRGGYWQHRHPSDPPEPVEQTAVVVS